MPNGISVLTTTHPRVANHDSTGVNSLFFLFFHKTNRKNIENAMFFNAFAILFSKNSDIIKL